ncbi:MAG: hypothetical protein M1479_08960 [Actinobacteria bacterium]|nr:hypothetical protein [Actinomycetota bacterium]
MADNKKNTDFARDLHSSFINSMESSYGAILNFLGFIIPSFTGFIYLIYKYNVSIKDNSSYIIFLAGTIAINTFLLWGSCYALALSYRYRYLQICVNRIEKKLEANYFMPASFNPREYKSIKDKILLSMAPAVLQIHILFFLLFIFGISLSFSLITWNTKSFVLIIIALIYIIIIYLIGVHFTNKYNKKMLEYRIRNIEKSVLEKTSEHLFYEVYMFKKTIDMLKNTQPLTINNLLIESFAIHFSNLFDFFYPRENIVDDDVIVSDFIDNLNDFDIKKNKKEEFQVEISKVNKQLTHLTYARNSYDEKTKKWNFIDIGLKMNKTLIAFYELLPNTYKNWNYFKELKKIIYVNNI